MLFSQRIGPAGPVGAPVKLPVQLVAGADPGLPHYDAMPDGRFLVLTEEPEPPGLRTPIVIVNWAAQLRTQK